MAEAHKFGREIPLVDDRRDELLIWWLPGRNWRKSFGRSP